MQLKYPHVWIFQHPIFLSKAFKDFQHQLHAAQPLTTDPEQLTLARLNPLIGNVLESRFSAVDDKLDIITNTIQEQSKNQQEAINQLYLTPLYLARPSTSLPGSSASSSSAVPSSSAVSSSSNGPEYRLDRNINNVIDVWKEYELGKNGFPPVKQLEETYKTKWRKDRTESRFFSKRKIIYDEIERLSKSHQVTTLEAATILESKRKQHSKTLDGFCTMIKNARKG